jgi:hypothetical protein
MTIATKNGSIIVKDGKLAENCGCCGGWYCYTPCTRAFAAPVTVILQGKALDPNLTQSFSSNSETTSNYPSGRVQERWYSRFGFLEYEKTELFAYVTDAGFGWSQDSRVNAGTFSGHEYDDYAAQQLLFLTTHILVQIVLIDSAGCRLYVKLQVHESIRAARPQDMIGAGYVDAYHQYNFSPVIESDTFASPFALTKALAYSLPPALLAPSHAFFYDWFAGQNITPADYPASITGKPCPDFSLLLVCDTLSDPRCVAL